MFFILKLSYLLLDPMAQEIGEAENESKDNNEDRPIFFISLVGSDAGDYMRKGIPRKAFYIFDVKSEVELEKHKIKFMSCQDLLEYYQKETGMNGEKMNVYELVQFFIKKNPNGHYLFDEVPLIKSIIF